MDVDDLLDLEAEATSGASSDEGSSDGEESDSADQKWIDNSAAEPTDLSEYSRFKT